MGSLIESINRYKNESITPEERDQTQQDVYIYGAGIVLSQLLWVVFINPFFFHASKTGMEIRVACCSLIYRKVSYQCVYLFLVIHTVACYVESTL